MDFKNAYNTPHRTAIAQALLQQPSIFKPFMRMFHLEYGKPSDLLFFANNSLHSVIESSCGVRQGSALSSLYFCALLQGPLKEVASLYPEVKIRAYQDDVTMSSTNSTSLAAAFLHLRESTQDLNLEINFNKCEWFKSSKTQEFDASPLRTLGVKKCEDSIKVLGGYIGRDKIVEEKLLEKMSKHECLFRRLRIMGPSNLSLAILKRCTVPRQDYYLRVHKPVATLSLAEEFDKEIQSVMMKWCGANGDSLKLATLPCKLGGLGIISTVVKQRYFFEASRKSIEELFKPTNAPVGCTGTQTSQSLMKSQNQASRTQLKKQMKSEHETLATKLNENPSIARITKRSKESNVHLDSAHNYVNPYLFKYTLMMRLGVSITKASLFFRRVGGSDWTTGATPVSFALARVSMPISKKKSRNDGLTKNDGLFFLS